MSPVCFVVMQKILLLKNKKSLLKTNLEAGENFCRIFSLKLRSRIPETLNNIILQSSGSSHRCKGCSALTQFYCNCDYIESNKEDIS